MDSVIAPARALLLFDGVCNLCNSGVRFLLPRDRKGVIAYAWLQSETGKLLAARYGIDSLEEGSFVLLSRDRAWTRSDAVLEVLRLLGGGWNILRAFRIVPRPWRDAVYNAIAKRRYRWFGKKDSCQRLPEKYLRRFRN